MKRYLIGGFVIIALILWPKARASAFTRIVNKGDTLASIAESMYGRIQHERLLVAANALDAQGGSPIVPGLLLEIPALTHRTVRQGETWASLATELLGAPHRAEVLAAANGTYPWLPPDEGAQIIVPYNLKVIVSNNDTIVTLAYKYLGNREKAWMLAHYNKISGKRLQRGDVLLIPLTDLPLTEAGKQAAKDAARRTLRQAAGETRDNQKRVDNELPALVADVRGGRYVDAVARGNRFLSSGKLTEPQLAAIHRYLMEAYAALDSPGLAKASCALWRKHARVAELDPNLLSPKLLDACAQSAP